MKVVQQVWSRRKSQAEIERLGRELADQIGRVERADADRVTLTAERDRALEELAAARKLAQRVATEQTENSAALTRRAETAESRAETAESRTAQLETHAAQQENDLTAVRQQVDQLQGRLAQQTKEAAASAAQSVAATEQLATTRDALAAERDRALDELAAAREQAQRVATEHTENIAALTRRAETAESRTAPAGPRPETPTAPQRQPRTRPPGPDQSTPQADTPAGRTRRRSRPGPGTNPGGA